MCGIVGYQGFFNRQLLNKMSKSISYRGPDNEGIWVNDDEKIGLAHQRLSIIDLSLEANQPMFNEDGSLVLVFNGEIYNYQELRRQLINKGHIFKSKSDAEVLLHLFEEESFDMLKLLNGIYAFAIWNSNKKELFLARDGLGVKPLYFTETDQGFLFASELKALLQYAGISRKLDYQALFQNLAYLWIPAPRTPLKEVYKLPPGKALLVKNGVIESEWTHYDLPYDNERINVPEQDIVTELQVKLQNAVERQMVSDVPLGAFLSGGLDSSAVVSMMCQVSGHNNFPCYSIGFSRDQGIDGVPNDLPYAKKVADHLGVKLETIEIDFNMISNLEKMIFHLDEPQADPAPINAMIIAERAKKDGVKVLLSGTGGDDIFSGYRRHLALVMEKYWAWMPLQVRNGLTSWASSGKVTNSSLRRLKKTFYYANLPENDRLVAYFLWANEKVIKPLFVPEIQALLAGEKLADPLKASLLNIPLEEDPLNRMLYLEAKHFLADHNLNYTDKTSMAHGVEVRVPLLDPDLIDFAVKIPTSLKQKGRTGKYIFKKAMEPYLPKDVIYRPKTGFGAPLRYWLNNELKEMVDELLSKESLLKRGVFDPKAVSRLIELDRKQRLDASYTIFALICIELWCRIFIDQPTPTYN